MMYVVVCCQLSVLECVSFERVGYTPDSIKLLKELVLVLCATCFVFAIPEGPKGELFSCVYDSNTTGIELGHLCSGCELHSQAVIEKDMCGRKSRNLLL